MNTEKFTPSEETVNDWIYKWGETKRITDDDIILYIVKNTVDYVIAQMNQPIQVNS
jgi:hypothetical protein